VLRVLEGSRQGEPEYETDAWGGHQLLLFVLCEVDGAHERAELTGEKLLRECMCDEADCMCDEADCMCDGAGWYEL
jgi:hypothetical protein